MDFKAVAIEMAEEAIRNISEFDIRNELEWLGVEAADLEDATERVEGYLDNADVYI